MANVKITSLTGYGAASNADVFVVVDVAGDTTKKITLSNLRTSIGSSNAGDLLNVSSGLSGANTAILNLQGGLSGANAAIADVSNQSNNNTYITWLVASANDGSTLATAYANDYASYSIFAGAFSGSNARLGSTESNVIALQGGISGSNISIAAITNSPVTFQSDVSIRGNLTLTGNTTIVSANTISFGDSLISLAANNVTSDNLDIGLYGHYWDGSANNHAGLFRDATNKDWFLFSNYTIDLEGNSTITISDGSFSLGNLRVKSANASQDVYAANSLISPSVYSNGVELRSNDYITYTRLYANVNSVQSNLTAYAAYANSTFSTSNNTPASVTYIVSNYTTTAVNSYPIGAVVSSVNNVSIYLNGVYQNKNQYILSNSSSNIQFTDASLASSLSLEIVTIR
jgi:hypothetical protein